MSKRRFTIEWRKQKAVLECDLAQASAPLTVDGTPTRWQSSDARQRVDLAVALAARWTWPEAEWPKVPTIGSIPDDWDEGCEAWDDLEYTSETTADARTESPATEEIDISQVLEALWLLSSASDGRTVHVSLHVATQSEFEIVRDDLIYILDRPLEHQTLGVGSPAETVFDVLGVEVAGAPGARLQVLGPARAKTAESP